MPVTIQKKDIHFYPNPERVITHFFNPGDGQRNRSIIQRVLQFSDEERAATFNHIFRQFSNRHRNITRIFTNNFNEVRHILDEMNIDAKGLSNETRLIIGAYFTKEYSIESAAFFNPSIVEDPYQGDLRNGQKRIITSFRATGEGHISSIAFRSGIIDRDNELIFETVGDLVDVPEVVKRVVYDKKMFLKKLEEMDIKKDVIPMIMDQLSSQFIYGDLQAAIANTMKNEELSNTQKRVIQDINWLASSHYEVSFSLDTTISERVLFPVSYTESNGIEDARFVRFTDEKGLVTYYATYTAYNGYTILPKLIQTRDFCRFEVKPINGEYAQNKGLALFPRKINGQYAMLSRIDGVNNYIMFSEQINLWKNAQKISEPRFPWELIQVGNAGSPIETDHGWLVITHGVGPVRTYSLGAILLDIDDPTKVIGRLNTPLLVPNEGEREGYVPNVVYSCGSMIHNDALIIPHSTSDYASTFACIPLGELFDEMTPAKLKVKQSSGRKDLGSVLLVDDDAAIRRSVSGILTQMGYRVTLAADGVDALMLIAKEEYDVILSDIRMPNYDGFQLLHTLNKKDIHIPVIFMTGHVEPEYKEKSTQLGAVEFIGKPFGRDVLLQTLEKVLKIKNVH